MTGTASIDQDKFRSILTRNITLPLGMGALSAALFVGLIFFLLSSLSWVEHTERVIGNANEISKLSIDMETGMRGYLITGDETFLQPYDIAKSRIASETAALSGLVGDNPQQVDRLRRIASLQAQWNEFGQNAIDLRRQQGNYQEVIRAGRGKAVTDEMRREFLAFIAMERRLLQDRNEDAKSITLWSVVLYLVFTLGVSGLLAFFGRRELVRLSDTYTVALNQQAADAAVLQEQAWLRTGQTQLAEHMIGQQVLGNLGRSVLDFLARYLRFEVGAAYLREDNGSLRRIASYGFSQQADEAEQTFAGNESLVAQAALENRVLQLDDLPAGYLKVSSGLGDAAPRHVLIVPVVHEGLVNGVVELGFLRELSPRDIEFLKLIGGSVGTSIHSALYREQLQDALAETQQLNEELQVQQEELRTANEELEEQSRALRASQATLENQQAELEQTNSQLSERTEALDLRNAALRRVQADLEDRAQELQRASRYKSEFLANMSHELRTPLNSALILAKLLGDNPQGNLSAEQVKFAESIYSSGNDLLVLINDILDIAKVEAGKLELVAEEVPLAKPGRQPGDDLHAAGRPEAARLPGDRRARCPGPSGDRPPAPGTGAQEPAVERAQVHRPRPGRPRHLGRSGRRCPLRGARLGHRHLARSAGSDLRGFRQADGTTSRRYGGTGLGLSISRDLTKLLGGTLTVDSTPGQGSTFTLTMPAEAPLQARMDAPAMTATPARLYTTPAAAMPAASPTIPAPVIPQFADDRAQPRNASRRVLVVEDEPQFAHILYDLAHELGYQCIVAHGAGDGFDLATQLLPDAILLDMRLPDAPGLNVLQKLKDQPQTRHIPVHIVSAMDHTETAMHMGAIGYALKPASREQLKQVFQKLEDKLTQKVKTVLLVEDDAVQRDAVVKLIGDDDVAITAVGSGEEALDLLRTRVFDCMVTDLRLPDMQGSELLKKMATEEICSFPPVIVYTGRNLTRDEEAELLRYSRSIIIKGARSPERLLDEVTLFLHKVEADLSTERRNMLKAARGRDRVFEGRRILLVDDDVRNIFALTSALEQRGAIVEIGRNGREALEKLDRVADIDLVLMDVMMPEMDGLEATRRLRQDPRFEKLPVITVTAKATRDDQEQCLAAGASDYLAKPVDLDRLFSLLRVWMPKMERL
jgi:CheY-like chemotaxis protein/CHASE3 domain sensor protein